MMRKIIIPVLLLMLLSCQPAQNYKTILLKTSGYVEVEPNEASFSVNVYCINKDVKTSKECLFDASDKLTGELLNFGVKKEDVKTEHVSLNKEYTWRNNSQVFIGYRVSTIMQVKVRDITKLDAMYEELLGNDKLDVWGLQFSHNAMDSLNNIAYLDALNKANVLADELLKQIPAHNKMITQVSNIEIKKSDISQDKMEYRAFAAEAEVGKSKSLVNSGTIRIENQLFVEYKVY